MTSSPKLRSSATLTGPVVLPVVSKGDDASLIFIISKGNSIVKLRADKDKLDAGEITSCEGLFTLKFTTGTPRRIISRTTCDLNLRIDAIEDTDCGLKISGEITQLSNSNLSLLTRQLGADQNLTTRQVWLEQLSLLQIGSRVQLIHRGASSNGAIIYIHNQEMQRIHLPHIPEDIKQPMVAPAGHTSNDKPRAQVRSHLVNYNGTRSLPYRY